MDAAAFATDRGERLSHVDDVLRPIVRVALREFVAGNADWAVTILDAAVNLWHEHFEVEAPGSRTGRGAVDFRQSLRRAMDRTSTPTDPPEEIQVARVARWVGAYLLNDATYSAALANGHRQKRWVDRHDDDVRRTHRDTNGQTVSIAAPFIVDGRKLRFPGDPVGPPALWINCRCVVQPVGKGRAMTSASSFDVTIDVDPEPIEEPPTHAGLAVRALDSGRVLMLQRALDDNDGGYWEFPGGSIDIEAGESASDGARREWSEEVGLPLPDGVESGDWLTPDGVYAGFVLDVETEFPIHERENVGDPEEGDIAEQVPEAIAWWAPGDLVDNPVVRPALAHDLADIVLPVLLTEEGEPCPCCGGSGEHDTGKECYGCDASGKAEYFTGPLPCEGATADTPATEVGKRFVEIVMDAYHSSKTEGDPAMTDTITAAAAPVVDEVAPAVVEEPADIDEEVEIPFHGVAAKIGVVSGDGRRFTDEVRTRQLPLPFWLDDSSAHSPDTGTRRAGRLDHLWVDDDGLVKYDGVLQPNNPAAAEIVEGYVFGNIRSVSVDLGDLTMAFSETETWNDQPVQDYSMVEIAGLSAVGIGAFREGYFALGPWEDEASAAPDVPPELAIVAAAIAAGITTPVEEGLTEDAAAELAEFLDFAGIVDLTELDDAALAEYDALSYEEQDAWLRANHPDAIIASGSFAPGTHDGPGWITDPIPTERIRRYWTKGEGAAKIRWGIPGDFNRCRKQLAKYILNPDWLAGACANMHKEAIGVWPGQEGGEGLVASASIALVAHGGAPAKDLPREWFMNPELEETTRLTITPEGQVFGHLAQWGVCHIGVSGMCTEAPTSETAYSAFHTGVVETTEGEVLVGHLVHGLGHASTDPNVTAAAATAFYDRSDAMFADVVVGEDDFGIWFSGALRPSVSEDTRRELKAIGSLSGDWRRIYGSLELIGVVAVGVPGFPIPARMSLAASGGFQTALVAAGVIEPAPAPSGMPDTTELVKLAADEVERRVASRQRAAAAKLLLGPAVADHRLARAAVARELLTAGREA